MESILLIVFIVLLVLDIDERRGARRSGGDQTWEEAGTSESRVRSLTDRAVLAMMNEVRRAQQKQP
jgi:hypothetical protein